MVRYLLLILLVNCAHGLNAQVLELKILNVELEGLKNYSVSINDTLRLTEGDQSTVFLKIRANDAIRIEHTNYEPYLFKISNSINTVDTITKLVKLIKVNLLEEVIITANKYVTIPSQKNDFIQDYFLYPNDFLILLTKNRHKSYLKLKKVDASSCVDSLAVDIAFSQLFQDALGNFFLIGEKTVQQFNVINGKLVLQNPTSKSEFNDFIAPLIMLADDLAVFERWADHNQRYSLLVKNKNNTTALFEYFDDKKYENALYHYNKTIDFYMQVSPEGTNVILMGIWDGDLMTLNLHPNDELEQQEIDPTSDLILMTAWSDKIASKKLKLSSFDLIDFLLIINAEANSFYVINDIRLNKRKTIQVDFKLTGDYFHDYFYNNIYMFDKEDETTVVYKLNVADGSRKKIEVLPKGVHPRNIKVINDKVYFTVLDENQYTRLIRVK